MIEFNLDLPDSDDFSCPSYLKAIKCEHEFICEEEIGTLKMVFGFESFITNIKEEIPWYLKLKRKGRFCIKCEMGNTKYYTIAEPTQFPTSE